MEKTIFSKIANREIPADIVWEDENFIAFLDVLPVHLGHTIVIPKRQVADLEDLSAEELGGLMLASQKVGAAMLKGLDVKGYSLFLDNKDAASRHVPHVHMHVVPRVEGDSLSRWPQTAYDAGEAANYAEKIKQALA
ncbi:MAG: HIT family protein [Candidatus Falkowbacteria bacterium]|nr:HIT family protein [Candidatus Falkowbacteria bacterium]